jgi:hypothetical protein
VGGKHRKLKLLTTRTTNKKEGGKTHHRQRSFVLEVGSLESLQAEKKQTKALLRVLLEILFGTRLPKERSANRNFSGPPRELSCWF